MAKVWTRLLMGLVFVFVTMTSPLHAQASAGHDRSPQATAETTAMPGMDAACTKAMTVQAAKDKVSQTKKAVGHMGDNCCSDGCNCPLSHCPATPALLTFGLPTVFHREASSIFGGSDPALPSYLADTLKRPPRA